MYLRTPKRYTRGQRRSIISLRWIWLWLLTPIIVIGGWQIYENREDLRPRVEQALDGIINNAESSVATAMAPTPMPTENPEIRLVAAEAAWQRGAIEEAVNIYNDVVEAVPNDVGVHYFRTLGLVMDGQLNQALSAAESTVTADPYSADAWAIRAMVLNQIGESEQAIPSALRALELAGDNEENFKTRARAQAYLAEAYLNVGQYERALSTVDRALEINPDSFEALHVRSRISQYYLFDFESAMKSSQAAYDLAPNLPYLALETAILDLREENTDQAVAVLADMLELNPNNTSALYWMGRTYFVSVGDPTQAADYLQRCIVADPENIECHYLLGRAQMRLEQYASAVESFERTIQLNTTSARHYWWAGRAQVVQNGCPGALNYLRQGYEMAKVEGDSQLILDFEDQMQSCQLFVAPSAESTEDPNATEEPLEEPLSEDENPA